MRIKKRIWVENDDWGIIELASRLGWMKAQYGLADMVIFSGGSDVDPSLYGEKNVASGSNLKRDLLCKEIFEEQVVGNRPMVGICRGAQFLHVANGGRMWQDVDKHAIGGTHAAKDWDGSVHLVTSTHHQMMRVTAGEGDGYDGEIITQAHRATFKRAERATIEDDFLKSDLEVMWYPSTRSLCYQPHPEYGVKTCLDHFVKLLERFELR